MFKRKITQDLIEWRLKPNRDVLIVKGPKGIGKSTIIEKFARENYKYFIKLDFEENPKLIHIFDGDLDIATITKKITLFLQTEKVQAGHTLFFFDEVHLCPNARAAMKILSANNRYDCIMATSYFSVNPELFPVTLFSHEALLDMNSMDFEEYLWANGITDKTISELKTYFDEQKEVPTILHETMLDLFKEYMIVGGMPEVIDTFFQTHNFKTVAKKQMKIVSNYITDIKQYLSKPDYAKIVRTIETVSKQLEKDNKKFQYGTIEYRSTARKYENSILWLYYVDMVNICFNLSSPKLPFTSYAKHDIFKVYFKDIGLLSGCYGAEVQQALMFGDMQVKNAALLEAVVADILMKSGKKLYYFSTNTTLEVDFFIKHDGIATPVEVKSADNTKSKTMKTLFENYGFDHGIKLSMKNFEVVDHVTRYPIYMAMFL